MTDTRSLREAALADGTWDQKDSHDSYFAAIDEIGKRVREGIETAPTAGYFGREE